MMLLLFFCLFLSVTVFPRHINVDICLATVGFILLCKCLIQKKNAMPYAAHYPIPSPYHWREERKIQLKKDVEMGILQKVLVGERTEWCM